MPVRFLHTADWQIGKPFARIEAEHPRALVRQERLNVLARLAGCVRERQAAFVLVAGDLFDSPRPDKATVSAACAAIGALGVPVYAIPGNHDHGGPDSLWQQPFFRQEQAALAPNLQVLLAAEPVETAEAVLLPCPLLRRHEATDTTAWLRGLNPGDLPAGKPCIALAHGTVQDFGAGSEDEDDAGAANHLDLSRLPDFVDYLALGDWHGLKQVHPRGWYAGTPEPDRFPRGAGNLPGHVLSVSLDRGQPPAVTPIPTGRLLWHALDFHAEGEADVARLEAQLTGLLQGRTQQDLLRLTLTGSLDIGGAARLEALLETWGSRLLRLRLHQRIATLPSAAEIQSLTERGDAPLTARVAARLLDECHGDAETAEIARLALRELHRAVND